MTPPSTGFLVLGVTVTVAVGLGVLDHIIRRRVQRHVSRALDPSNVVILDAHRAARLPGSNVALIHKARKQLQHTEAWLDTFARGETQ